MSDQKKKNPLLTLLVIINSIIVVFILIKQLRMNEEVELITRDKGSARSNSQELPYLPKAKSGSVIKEFNFGKFTANLAKADGPQRYITIEIVLYIETVAGAALLEIENKKPNLRDEVISILNTRTPQEVLKLEGRGILKSLLKNHLNNDLKSDQVKELLFTKFMVN